MKFYHDKSILEEVNEGLRYTYRKQPESVHFYWKAFGNDSTEQAFNAGAQTGVEMGIAYGAARARQIVDSVVSEGKQIIKQTEHQNHETIVAAEHAVLSGKKEVSRNLPVKVWSENAKEPSYYKSVSEAVKAYGKQHGVSETQISKHTKSNNIGKSEGKWVAFHVTPFEPWAIKRRYTDKTKLAYNQRKAIKSPHSISQKSYDVAINKAKK